MISALNNLRKKETSLTLRENMLHAERVRSYPCFYNKTCKEHKERRNKAFNRKKETVSRLIIILFKHSMPSPNVKRISLALHILCVIKNS